jgi:preprotein translocase SecE subunit
MGVGVKEDENEAGFERTERPEPAPASNATAPRFHAIAVIGAVLAALCLGASVYFLFMTPVEGGAKVPANVWMAVGGAVALAGVWVVVTKLSPKLAYAKPGQGRWARAGAYVGVGVMALFAAIALHRLPGYWSKWYLGDFGLWHTTIFGAKFTLRPVFFPAVALFLGSMVAFHLFVNRPRPADFLIETQGEMKRVSWPTRREWMGSTMVVLVLVFLLSMFLFGVDQLLTPVMRSLRIGF